MERAFRRQWSMERGEWKLNHVMPYVTEHKKCAFYMKSCVKLENAKPLHTANEAIIIATAHRVIAGGYLRRLFCF